MFKLLKDILSSRDGAGDLFHFGAAAGVVVFLFLEIMRSARGWTVDPDFGVHFGAVILASAAAFPIRDIGKPAAANPQGAGAETR